MKDPAYGDPANASSISDGAAVLVLMRASEGRAAWFDPRWRGIVGHSSHAQAPAWFTTAPTFRHREVAGADWLERRQCGFV